MAQCVCVCLSHVLSLYHHGMSVSVLLCSLSSWPHLHTAKRTDSKTVSLVWPDELTQQTSSDLSSPLSLQSPPSAQRQLRWAQQNSSRQGNGSRENRTAERTTEYRGMDGQKDTVLNAKCKRSFYDWGRKEFENCVLLNQQNCSVVVLIIAECLNLLTDDNT